MDEPALRILLSSLEASRSTLHWWLEFWTFLVVTGVAFEVVFVVWEYVEEYHDFKRAIIHPPERPSTLLFALGLMGAALVGIGVGGELYAESKIETVETRIRKANDDLFLLLSKQAGDAATSARIAHEEADAVKVETDVVEKRLENASRQLRGMEQQVRIQGPRKRLLEENRDEFLKAIKPFAGQRVTVVKCGYAMQAEPEQLEQYLMTLLGVSKVVKPNAGWVVESPGYSTWARCNTGASSVGGNLVIVSSAASGSVKAAANALYDALNKIDISTVRTESTPEGRQLASQTLGNDSPWELAVKDPTAVIILIGTNPMFDLSGWHQRHK